jgi:hypothetical protein
MGSMNPARVWLVMMAALALASPAEWSALLVVGEAEWASPITAMLR